MAEVTKPPPSGSGATAKETAQDGEPFSGEVVIEMGDERNRRFLWAPLGVELRGRWSRVNCTGDEMTEQLAMIPDIPGMQIVVNCNGRSRRMEVRDPLNDEKNQDLFEQLRKAVKDAFRTDQVPVKTTVVENADNSAVKTWLYYMRRFVNGCPIDETQRRRSGGPQAFVVRGTLPSLEEIAKLPGKTRIEFGNQSPLAVRYLEDRKAAI